MFLYVQTTDNKEEKWGVRKDRDLPEVAKSCKHRSVYLQADPHHDELDYAKVKLLGDFQLDIDAGDIADAIVWLNRLLDLLQKWELPLEYLDIYISGGKGFHITIPQRLFEDKPKSQPRLNKTHSAMAAELCELAKITLDMNLYHNRHMIRIANQQRSDGKYKVPVTVEEVRSMKPIDYMQLGMNPREPAATQLIPASYYNAELGKLWLRSKAAVEEHYANHKKTAVLRSEDLDTFNDTHLPKCIEWIRDQFCPDGDPGFNKQAMNVAAFIGHAANLSEVGRERLLHDCAERLPSDSKPHAGRKLQELRTKIKAAEGGGLDFSCAANCAVLQQNPCDGCPIKEKQITEAEELTSISEETSGYWLNGSKGTRLQLTDFTLSRQFQVFSMEGDSKTNRGETLVCTSYVKGQAEKTLVKFGPEAWNSVAAFKSAMNAVMNVVVITNRDLDITALHMYFNRSQTGDAHMRLSRAGIHVVKEEDDGPETNVWIEPNFGFDIHGDGVKFTYTGTAGDTLQSYRGLRKAHVGDPLVADHLMKLFRSNRPDAVGQMLGWTGACFLKEHLNSIGLYDFPLLHIAGKPGSGKTQSAILYAALTGAKGMSPIPVDSGTPSPIRQAMSQTTTIARVFDEFNRVNMSNNKFLQVLGYLKSAYCRQNLAVGIITKKELGEVTAGTSMQYATAPVIYMSREPTENEELRQRSIIVRIRQEDQGVDEHQPNFQFLREGMSELCSEGNTLQQISKRLINEALRLSTERVREMYLDIKKDMPLDVHARLVHNIYTVRLGLKFIDHVFSAYDPRIAGEIKRLDEASVKAWVEEDLSDTKIKNWSTSEVLVETLSTMAEISELDRMPGRLIAGTHYIKRGAQLFIHPHRVYGVYRMYCAAAQLIPEVTTPNSLAYMLEHTRYFASAGPLPWDATSRGWTCLDCSILDEIGINTHAFIEK